MSDDKQPPVIRDLQSLLRQSIGKDVILLDHEEKPLLAKGENFASTMLSVKARIKRAGNDSPEEILSLVAKTLPQNEAQSDSSFNRTGSFGKEIFIFEKWLPQLRELEREAGVKEDELIDLLPKYYGGRLSLSEETSVEADEDTVMLMENLKDKGYYLLDRMIGLDYEHALLVLRELARFQALSTAMRVKKPAAFEEAKRPLDVFPFDIKMDEFAKNVEHIVNLVCTDARVAPYSDRIRSAVKAANGGMDYFTKLDVVEPFVSFQHGDLWLNNILFSRENARDVKIIDYQFSRVGSPLRDIPYLILGNCQKDVVEERFDDLLDAYYSKFIETLKQVGCDTSPFSRECFDEQLKKDAFSEMFRCIFAIKFFTFEAGEDTDMSDVKSSLIMTGANEEFFDRSCRCIAKYIEKGWI